MSDAKIEEAKAALRAAAHRKRAAFHPSLRSEAARIAAGHFFDRVPIETGEVVAGYYNGDTYTRADPNDQKAFRMRATVRPFPGPGLARGLRLTAYVDQDHSVADAARDRSLPGDLRITALHLDGVPLAPTDRLVFMPDGFGIPFRVGIEARGLPWAVEGDAAGSVMLVDK